MIPLLLVKDPSVQEGWVTAAVEPLWGRRWIVKYVDLGYSTFLLKWCQLLLMIQIRARVWTLHSWCCSAMKPLQELVYYDPLWIFKTVISCTKNRSVHFVNLILNQQLSLSLSLSSGKLLYHMLFHVLSAPRTFKSPHFTTLSVALFCEHGLCCPDLKLVPPDSRLTLTCFLLEFSKCCLSDFITLVCSWNPRMAPWCRADLRLLSTIKQNNKHNTTSHLKSRKWHIILNALWPGEASD